MSARVTVRLRREGEERLRASPTASASESLARPRVRLLSERWVPGPDRGRTLGP